MVQFFKFLDSRIMAKPLLITFISIVGILISSCTHSEIESNANEAGNVMGRTIRGVGSGLYEGIKGKDK